MRTNLVAVGAILITLGTALARGQDMLSNNGYWWNGQSEDFKLAFITGYTDAMAHAGDLEYIQCTIRMEAQRGLPTSTDIDVSSGIGKACLGELEQGQTDFSHTTVGQVADGVDEFYKDFRNKLIGVVFALDYVRDELKNKSADELGRELKMLRTLPTPNSKWNPTGKPK